MILRSIAFLLCATFPPLVAAQVRIVSPGEFATAEANSFLDDTCCDGQFRLQHVFLADDFSSLPDHGAWLTSLAFRPDADAVTAPQEKWLRDTEMSFSTTSSGIGSSLNRDFSNNRVNDAITVKTGDFALATGNLSLPNGTKEFDYVVEFDQPYLYDPTEGNLLFEWAGRSEASLLFDFSEDQAARIVFGNGLNVSRGDYFGSFVVEFTFVPEPSSGWLSGLAGIAIVGCLRRRR